MTALSKITKRQPDLDAGGNRQDIEAIAISNDGDWWQAAR